MTTKKLLTALCLAVALIGTRPAPAQYQPDPLMRAPAPSPVLGYFRDRMLDFVDMFRLKLHVGSIGAAARVTTLVQVGAVHTNGPVIGIERRAAGHWWEYRNAFGISAAYTTEIETAYIWGNEFADPTGAWNQAFYRGVIRNGVFYDDGRDRYLSIGAEVHLGIGLDVGFYPEELADFLLGIFTIDFLEDDLVWTAGDPFFNQGQPLPPL